MKVYAVISCIVFLTVPTNIGRLIACSKCMDNSYHCKEPYDYKNYHKVKGGCDCECWRYPRSLDRGKCRKCQHYHAPDDSKLEVFRKKECSKQSKKSGSRDSQGRIDKPTTKKIIVREE